MMQEWIVAVIVGYAFWIIAKRYAPKSVQKLLRTRTERIVKRLGWAGLARKLEAKTATASSTDGCGACGDCSASKTSSPVKTFTIKPESIKRTNAPS
jgi:hypothetical protein